MTASPLISVIVPAYNAQDYLGQCVRSVLAQSVADFELIIIDDGSTDTTGGIADAFAKYDGRIKVIHQRNQGLSAARNAGMDIAIGQFTTFVDADDALHPEFLKYAIQEVQNSEADIFSCAFTRRPGKDWEKLRPGDKVRALRPYDAIKAILYQRKNMLCSAWAHLYKTSTIRDLRFTEGILYEDLDFFYRAYENARLVVHSDFPFYFYRESPNGILSTFTENRLDVLTVTDRIAEHFKDNPCLWKAAIDRRFAANFNMYALCSQRRHPAAQRCWQGIKADRLKILLNAKSRLKNRAGALASFLGQPFIKALSRILYSK